MSIIEQAKKELALVNFEWFIHDCNGMYAQNLRCSTVFKSTKDGPAYNIDVPGRPPITFPYWPDKADIPSPVVEIG